MFWGWRARKAESRTVVAYNLTEPPAWAVLTGARLARAVSVGLVADVNKPGEVVPAGFRWRFDYRWAVRLIRRFDRLITVREDIARKYAPGTPFLVVPGGVPARLVGRNPEPPAGHPPAGPFTVAFAGALTPLNGVALLLQAMALLEGEPFRLRIAGRGPLEAEVRAAAAVDGRVEYCGFLGADQVAALYEGASLLADVRVGRGMDPSRFFQGKLIEYMASGRPVLTTARGPSATADLVFRFEGTSGQELAATLRQLAAMPLEALAARAHAARQWVASEATWEAQGRRIREFLAGEGRLPVPRAG
jgi:glycosyltransferase involved in cell wall biosynthesis